MRIIYWNTSCLEPEIEAVSKELFQLAAHFRPSLLFSINPQIGLRGSLAKRYVGFHPRFDPLLRLIIPLIESSGDINHVYGEVCPWTFSKALKRKPLILTIASEKGKPQLDFLDRCRKIIVQTEAMRGILLALGVEASKTVVLYPAVDLQRFTPRQVSKAAPHAPKVLFATAPRTLEEMEDRGVQLLLAAAKDSPEVRYHLLYRQWRHHYTSLQPTKELITSHKLHNVTLTNGVVDDMPSVYRDHHFTVVPYTKPDGGKECPNSVIEGLACGLPALVSSATPFSDFVATHKCGIVFEPNPSSLVAAIDEGLAQYQMLSNNAASIAREFFSHTTMFGKLAQVYRDVL
jgi:glycosyltransferase involved in cell wall biosynthesis